MVRCEIEDGEHVSDERRSALFKTLQVVRFFDRQRNVLVYVAYTTGYRRQPEEQHQLCSDQELAETVVVEPVGVGNFVTEQATQGQDVLSRRRDAASTRPKPGDTESGRHEVVKPAACIAAGQYQRRQSQGAPKQGGTSDYRYVSGRRS